MNKVFSNAEEYMKKTIKVLEGEYIAIRAGRANPAVLEKILVDYYGTATPISQLASIAVTEARTLTISPWEATLCKEIEKAIHTSDLGINPQSDGKMIRVTFPPLNEERRREIVKEISKLAENAKISLRSIRRDALEKIKRMKKDSLVTQDDIKHAEKRAQEITDRYCKEIEILAANKEKEIMSI